LDTNERYNDLIGAKKHIRNAMRQSFYFVESALTEKADFNATIERYSDRYLKQKKADLNKWSVGEYFFFNENFFQS
jgi:hypothetical protein